MSGPLASCGRAHPEQGSRVVCELPEGHDGNHRGKDPGAPAGDSRFWLWTDDFEVDSE